MSSISARIPAPLRSLLARGLGSALLSGLAGVFLLTLGGKVVSFFKDAFVVSTFGVSDDLDVFMLVFGFVTFAASLLAGGLPESFLPAYVELKLQKGARRADRMAVQTAACHLLSLLAAALVLVFGVQVLIGYLAQGFGDAKKELAQALTARLVPFLLCFGMSFVFAAWLRANKKFFIVAASPLLVPLTTIVVMLATRRAPDVNALVLGANLGAALQLSLMLSAISSQLPASAAWWRVALRKWEPALAVSLRTATPFLFGALAFGSASVVDQTMAAWLPAGSVTVLSYSEKLCGIILGVSAGPVADVLFPYFADHVARQDWARLRRWLLTSVAIIIAATLPLVMLLDVLAPWVVSVLFERGAFSHEDTQRVAEVLRFGALQIPFYILGIVTARVVVSLQESKLMLVMSTSALFANAGLNWLLMQHMGVAGIALSTALVHATTSIFTCTFCLRLIRRKQAAPVHRGGVAFIIRDLGHGGAQRQLSILTAGLVKEGHTVTVLHFYGGPFEQTMRDAGVNTLCIGKKSRWDLLGFFFRLAKAAQSVRPEVLHGYLAESNLMALFLKPFCGFPRVVWGVRDSQTDAHLWGTLGKLSFRLNCLLARFADVIICNSKAGHDYYLAKGYPAHKMHVVPNGIDTGRFKPSPHDHPLTFGLVGRMSPMKDIATFIKAAALVPDARFVVVGSGDEGYAQQMRELASSLSVKVEWIPARSDMPDVYATFDCLVNSSAFGEGFSNVIGEAMACDVPCIASDVGDSAWIIGNPAQIFPAGDHEALAKCMREFKRSETRSRIVAEFSIERLIERTTRLLGKKVMWLTTGLGSGGAEMMLAQLVNGLPKVQHVVVSLTAGGKHAASIERVHSLDMPAGKPTLSALWKLFRIVRREKPDVLMGWMYHGCLAAVLARFCRIKPVPMMWNVRQSLYDLKHEKRGSALVIRALARLSWLPSRITYNTQLGARQHEAIGYAKSKTMLVPNGFDVIKWQPRTPTRGLIGRFGRNAAMKDYPTFIEAAKLIHAKHPEARFIIVGAETSTLEVPPFIEVLGERHDLPELTASLNIAVSSSAFGEGFPNVVGEAMACAVPVVATDIGDTRWVMGETGRLVPPSDPQALADACIEILDKGITQDLAARERIEEHFSLTSALGQFEALITTEETKRNQVTEGTSLTSDLSLLTSH